MGHKRQRRFPRFRERLLEAGSPAALNHWALGEPLARGGYRAVVHAR